jgi:hypothetical protein
MLVIQRAQRKEQFADFKFQLSALKLSPFFSVFSVSSVANDPDKL